MLYICLFDLLCYNKVAVPLYTLLFICGIGPGPPGDPRGIKYLIVLSIIVVFLLHNMNLLTFIPLLEIFLYIPSLD